MTNMKRIEKEVWGNDCRSCNRPIAGKLVVADRDDDGYPRCSECAKDLGLCSKCGAGLDDGFACLGDCPIPPPSGDTAALSA